MVTSSGQNFALTKKEMVSRHSKEMNYRGWTMKLKHLVLDHN